MTDATIDPNTTQTEAQLEAELMGHLQRVGWEPVVIRNQAGLLANLRAQLQRHNGFALSEGEFAQVLRYLDSKSSVFDKAHLLRGRCKVECDDGSVRHVQFLNVDEWCRNQYQVTQQISQTDANAYVDADGVLNHASKTNRYDVTLLVNGLPLVQIELKRRGLELREAFNQIRRYQAQTYGSAGSLFGFVQLFVMSNGVNTKYYANNRTVDFKQTFYWAAADNRVMTQLDEFAQTFLEKCHLSKMMSKYTVLHQSDKVLMVLRPYQFYAAEAIDARVKAGRKNGYIWHTTGSGKTLTSFATARLLAENPKVEKVVFVVDRADLDYQTTREFNAFAEGCVDETKNTASLVSQLTGGGKLIVTTIQKLNTALGKKHFEAAMQTVQHQRVVFIFDECHRSQFGETHANIVGFFSKAQLFGFTGTPIFEANSTANAKGKRTTADLFEERLHSYVITDAQRDGNVLPFSVEYWGKLKAKDGSLIDEEVAGINTKEFFENPDRIELVAKWVMENHPRKTHQGKFAALLCVGSVDAALAYYAAFKALNAKAVSQGKTPLRVATIFSFSENGEPVEADPQDAEASAGNLSEPELEPTATSAAALTRQSQLAACVADYNALYKTKESVQDGKAFYTYYKALAKRMKDRDKPEFKRAEGLDLLIVVNMFLTGFDAKTLNTLYVDKNLRYHGLIQAFSRTNRILGQLKSQGNIVCFRNLKAPTDVAVTLFSDNNPSEHILIAPYAEQVQTFNVAVAVLREIAATPDAVSHLPSEVEQWQFVKAFRQVMRLLNVLGTFAEFDFADVTLSKQEFADYKSKYLDLYDAIRKPRPEPPPTSILEDVDFELELIGRDDINVTYILQLLAKALQSREESRHAGDAGTGAKDDTARHASLASRDDIIKRVLDMLSNEPRLRSKRDLIEKFVSQYRNPHAEDAPNVATMAEDFGLFWATEKQAAIAALCAQEQLDQAAFLQLLQRYLYNGKTPLSDDIVAVMLHQPSILHRKAVTERISERLLGLVATFEDDMGA